MREILFRAKSLKSGTWTQGYLFRCWEHAYIAWEMVNDNADMVEVDPETVCQYTGLTDKNGRKIFEGDILKNWNGKTYTVVYDNHSGAFGFKNDSLLAMFRMCGFEVIGNIFDNPELIGEQP